MTIFERCPTCKKGRLSSWKGPVPVWNLVDVVGRGERCDSCEELLIAGAELARMEQVAAAALVNRGIATAREFVLVRKAAGLRASDVARLFDVAPETVSRWEHGERPIPRLASFALGELYRHPKLVRAHLDALARPKPRARTTRRHA